MTLACVWGPCRGEGRASGLGKQWTQRHRSGDVCSHQEGALGWASLLGTEEDSRGQRGAADFTSVHGVVGAGLSIQGGEEAGAASLKRM